MQRSSHLASIYVIGYRQCRGEDFSPHTFPLLQTHTDTHTYTTTQTFTVMTILLQWLMTVLEKQSNTSRLQSLILQPQKNFNINKMKRNSVNLVFTTNKQFHKKFHFTETRQKDSIPLKKLHFHIEFFSLFLLYCPLYHIQFYKQIHYL